MAPIIQKYTFLNRKPLSSHPTSKLLILQLPPNPFAEFRTSFIAQGSVRFEYQPSSSCQITYVQPTRGLDSTPRTCPLELLLYIMSCACTYLDPFPAN